MEVRTVHPQWYCPVHGAPLMEEGDTLVCAQGDSYPTTNGIARFVPASTYADAFGDQWLTFRKTQLDSETGLTITRDRLRRCFGEDLWENLAGKTVLEVGCGAGRFTEIVLEKGASLTSVDLSLAVDANAQNFPPDEQHRVAQADALKLPFKPQQFDIVFCLGVIEATPNPEETIARIYEHVKPGGWLVFDQYTYFISWYIRVAPLFRFYLRRIPSEKSRRIIASLAKFYLPLHKAVARIYPLHVLVQRISPMQTHYRYRPELNDELQKEWALLDTHDTLTDWYKHFRTLRSIRHTLEDLGLENIWCVKGGNGIEARGRRPGDGAE